MHFVFWKFLSVTLGIIPALCLSISALAARAHGDFYRAGVVEFRPVIAGMSSADMLEDHLRGYLDIIHSQQAAAADILVFPESTLNNPLQLSFVPDPADHVTPCDAPTHSYAHFLVALSCAARDTHTYLVINLSEKELCAEAAQRYDDPRPCATNGLNVFNTNVVFDRQGMVVARYRKVNLYLESKNTTYRPELAFFDTDFGVRFGLFTCFDILFYTPAQQLVERNGIQNFIFPSWWYSELPFLTGVQLQQSWAWANNVNLLAAGGSNPMGGTTGTGIYAGHRGHLQAVMAGGSGLRKLYIANVPKEPRSMPDRLREEQPAHEAASQRTDRQTDIKLMPDPRIENFTSLLLDFGFDSDAQVPAVIAHRLCHEDFCCRFTVAARREAAVNASARHYQYRLGVYKGSRSYEKEARTDFQVCALYACTSESVASCSRIFDKDAEPVTLQPTFVSISIVGEFEKAERLLIMPSSLDQQLYPLMANDVKWLRSEQSSCHRVEYSLVQPHNDLLTFGIYANYYERSTGAGHNVPGSLLLVSVALLLRVLACR